jgi:4-hydroxy-tetrahydrodipicolinate reductase
VTRIGIIGAGGRMGIALIQAVIDGGHRLNAAVDRAGHDAIGRDAGTWAGRDAAGVLIGDDTTAALKACDVALDFTTPEASVATASLAATIGTALVIGTTGINAAQDSKIARSSDKIAIVKSGNFSSGVAVMAKLSELIARALPDFDLEIIESHHKHKVDAPSGTALMIGQAAARGRQADLNQVAVRGRDGITGARPEGAIGFVSLRGGSIIGEHTLIAAGPGERIELKHIAEDRGIFARGAVRAAVWAAKATPGLYGIDDVLGI